MKLLQARPNTVNSEEKRVKLTAVEAMKITEMAESHDTVGSSTK
jgi:hypothetical protein